MKYNVRISCENQVRVFNFESAQSKDLINKLIASVVKSSYTFVVSEGHKKHRKAYATLMSLLEYLSVFRFYKKISKIVKTPSTTMEHSLCISFSPFDIKVVRQWIHTYDSGIVYTFFELEALPLDPLQKYILCTINFDRVRKAFEKKGYILYQSKTPGVWYTSKPLVLHAQHKDLNVFEKKIIYETSIEKKVIEL